MPTAKQPSTSSRLTIGPIFHQVLDEQLDRHDGQHDRDRLVEVAEALDQLLDERERSAAPAARHAGCPDRRTSVFVTANAAVIESTAKAMPAATMPTSASSSGVASRRPSACVKKCGPWNPPRWEDLAQCARRSSCPGRRSRRRRAGPVGEEQEQHTERVDEDVEALDQLDAHEDREAAHHEREDDAPEQEDRPVLVGHAEVREDQQEDEEVVEQSDRSIRYTVV